jgi:glycosyltransferase involved in cell wall biosynthesis
MTLPGRIGINLLYLLPGRVGGTETYARELIHALAAEAPETEFVVFCGREAAAALPGEGWPSNVRIKQLGFNAASKPLRILFELFALPIAARREKVWLLHSMGTTAPLWGGRRRVVTIHDLIFHHRKDSFPAVARLALELLVPLGGIRAARVIADSQATSDDLTKTYRLKPQKIDVVHLGLGLTTDSRPTPAAELRAKWQLGEQKIILCVASAFGHKNIPRLLESFAELGRGDTTLVVTGHAGLEQDRLIALAESSGVGDRVVFTGWVSRDDLEGLYAASSIFVYPTLIEGFGLPVLEAMARGVPVACSNVSSLPEVAGEAALLFDPLDSAAIGRAISALLDDHALREQKIAAGRKWSATFTWQRTARQTIDTYGRALV